MATKRTVTRRDFVGTAGAATVATLAGVVSSASGWPAYTFLYVCPVMSRISNMTSSIIERHAVWIGPRPASTGM